MEEQSNDEENIADILNYLASLDESGHEQTRTLSQSDGTEIEQTAPIQSTAGTVPILISNNDQVTDMNNDDMLQMVTSLTEQVSEGGFIDENQVVGSDYQSFTAFSTDGNEDEMNYMGFVTESDADNDTAGDMSVCDSSEDKQHSEIVPSDGTKTRIIPINEQESPVNAQAYTCNYCDYTSAKKRLLSRHMTFHSDERPYKCGLCEKDFRTAVSLRNHTNTHTGTKPFRCKHCESSFTTSGELVRHVRYRHTHQKPYKCTECEYASVEASKLRRHMRCHTGERPYQCPDCTYAAADAFRLKRHLRIHTGERPYECDICQAKFNQANTLKHHRMTHSSNKPLFHCELCTKAYSRKTDLRIHMQKLHSRDKLLECKLCGETLPDKHAYKLHSKTHKGEKCLKCELCSYASVSTANMDSHMVIHTGQKPFSCDECDQAFSQKRTLRRHKNLHYTSNCVQQKEATTLSEENDGINIANEESGELDTSKPPGFLKTKDVSSEDADDPDYIPVATWKKERRTLLYSCQKEDEPIRPFKEVSIKAEPLNDNQPTNKPIKADDSDGATDRIGLARQQAELSEEWLEQKKKDFVECFGFNDDEDETATVLAMSTVPGTKDISQLGQGPA